MNAYFKKLFTYNHWANQVILDSLEKYNIPADSEAIKIFSHVINAQYIWFSRIKNDKSFHKAVWSTHSLEAIKNFLPENFALWLSYIEQLNEVEMGRKIQYSNSEGHAFENIVADMLPHIVNHASYHRGQVNKLIRQAGFSPINNDYITWCRTVEYIG
jgi:uncharacterized damage-inducible protein DinB